MASLHQLQTRETRERWNARTFWTPDPEPQAVSPETREPDCQLQLKASEFRVFLPPDLCGVSTLPLAPERQGCTSSGLGFRTICCCPEAREAPAERNTRKVCSFSGALAWGSSDIQAQRSASPKEGWGHHKANIVIMIEKPS